MRPAPAVPTSGTPGVGSKVGGEVAPNASTDEDLLAFPQDTLEQKGSEKPGEATGVRRPNEKWRDLLWISSSNRHYIDDSDLEIPSHTPGPPAAPRARPTTDRGRSPPPARRRGEYRDFPPSTRREERRTKRPNEANWEDIPHPVPVAPKTSPRSPNAPPRLRLLRILL